MHFWFEGKTIIVVLGLLVNNCLKAGCSQNINTSKIDKTLSKLVAKTHTFVDNTVLKKIAKKQPNIVMSVDDKKSAKLALQNKPRNQVCED